MIYDDDECKCELCLEVGKSNGTMLKLNDCDHIFHIECIIDYLTDYAMKCPVCATTFEDFRLGLAVLYKRQDTQGFTQLLITLQQ